MALLLSGCVGIGVVHSKVEEYGDFALSGKPNLRPNEKGAVTKAELKSKWGEPDKIKNADDPRQQRWVYYDGLSWAGVIPMIGIGIPLILPSGHDYVEITFADEKAIGARRSRTGWTGFACGFLDEGGVRKGCDTLK